MKSSWLTDHRIGPAGTALMLASCGKSPEKQETPAAGQTAAPAPAGEQQQAQPVQPAPAEQVAPQQSTAPATNEQLVPIDIKLPKPMFVGTPTNIAVPNLEKPLGKARPPFLAPAGTKNVAAGKPVTSSDELPTIGELTMVTDGDKDAAEGSYVELGPKLQYVTIDLKSQHTIYAVVIWHFHKQAVVYHDVIVQVADDPDFVIQRAHHLQQRHRQHRGPRRGEGYELHRDLRRKADRCEGCAGTVCAAVQPRQHRQRTEPLYRS